jgi:hypothetical protein
MRCALVCDLNHNRDFPVTRPLLGRPMAVYPLMAARGARSVQRLYLMTEAQEVKSLALQYDCIIIDPPQSQSLEHFLDHGRHWIEKDLARDQEKLGLLGVLLTHAPAVTGAIVDEAFEKLQADHDADSIQTVSLYDHFHPRFALREDDDGWLAPFCEADRPSEPVWYPDSGLAVLKPRALAALDSEGSDRRWLGEKILALKERGGMPVHSAWEAAAMAHWLKEHGVPDVSPEGGLQPQPKLQPKPAKGDRR